jgi:transcriptional regulator with XRE-family HTH domain
MTGADLKTAREKAGATQAQAAARLGLTQAYLSMLERGHRPVTGELARQALRLFPFPPTALPLESERRRPGETREFAAELGALGYPGFSYLRGKPKRNPAQLLLSALDQSDLESRVVEALPWLAWTFAEMDWDWMVPKAKLRDRQNRLGFVVTVAGKLANNNRDKTRYDGLEEVRTHLELSRLAREDTLCHDSMTNTERKWLRRRRPPEARHWNLLTDLDVRHLAYAPA